MPELGRVISSVTQQDDAILRQADFLSRFPGIFDQRELGS